MIRMRITGVDNLNSLLRSMEHLDSLELVHKLSNETLRQVESHFEEGTGPEGRWASLAPATLSINPKRAGKTPLTDTGSLRSSIQASENRHSAEVFSTAPHASFQQFGASIKVFGKTPAVIPSRPFLGWTEEEEDELEDVAIIFIERLLSR